MSDLLINPFISFGGFDPMTAIPWHSVFWADDPAWSNPGNGVAVSTWRNGGTLGTAATQSTSSKYPIFRSSVAGYNSKATVEFDSADDELSTGAYTDTGLPMSMVIVANMGVVANGKVIYSTAIGATTYKKIQNDAGSWSIGTVLDSGVAVTTNPTFVVGVVSATASASKIVVAAATTTGTISPSLGMTGLFMNSVGDATPWAGGHRAFMASYVGDITAHDQWARLKAWVTSYYGLTT